MKYKLKLVFTFADIKLKSPELNTRDFLVYNLSD